MFIARMLAITIASVPLGASAQAAPANAPQAAASPLPAPSPAASAGAAGPSDPCTTPLAVVSRPSVTTSACTVKSNHVEIETGYQNTIPDGGAPVAQYPQALIRIGTGISNLEVSVGAPSENRSVGASGAGDTSFGAKYEVGYSSKWIYGVNAFVTVPTGTSGYSAGGTGYTGNVNLSYSLTPGVSLASTLGFNSLSDGVTRYASFIPSLVVSGMLTGSTALFGEIATFSHAAGPGSATRVQYLTGIQQSIANRLQFDLETGRSWTTATGKYRYSGVGLSYAF